MTASDPVMQFVLPEALLCPTCVSEDNVVQVGIEPVFHDGELLGLEAIVRFKGCQHRVPKSSSDVEALAHVLNQHDQEHDAEAEQQGAEE